MNRDLLRQAAPYLLLLAVAGTTFWLSGQITYSARAGQLGPDVWPKLACGLIASVCIYELIRVFTTRAEAARGITEALDAETEPAGSSPAYPKLLLAGILLTLGYGAVVPVLGFLLASFLYLVAFMYIGRYRAHATIWASSALGTLLFAVIFLKIVYVSLPRGVPPFDGITDLLTNAF